MQRKAKNWERLAASVSNEQQLETAVASSKIHNAEATWAKLREQWRTNMDMVSLQLLVSLLKFLVTLFNLNNSLHNFLRGQESPL